MYLLEHDAKELLAARGLPVPAGVLADAATVLPALPPGPWVVKAQLARQMEEAAGALVNFAYNHPAVRLVRAHTLPVANASTRVLTKCGFQKAGEIIDPNDGPVWRWVKPK